MKRIAVLCSGGGSNLQALIDACASGEIRGEVVFVLSTASRAGAIARAAANGIPCVTLMKRSFDSADACDAARHSAIANAAPDLIVCAGYLGILPAATVERYSGKILNIHPALIPSFCGKGMYGRHVHEAALAYGVKLSGATVHFVDYGTDTGPIVFQESVPVLDDDDADTLAARILPIEHRLLPRAVSLFCEDRLLLSGRKVRILPARE